MQTEPPRLLLDGMLEGLARRLRFLGYDCALAAQGGPALVTRARAEQRSVVTASPAHQAIAPAEIVLLREAPVEEQVAEIVRRFPIDAARFAFTRCSRDNTPLVPLNFEIASPRLPARVRERHPDPVWHCPACDRLYWPGTHSERIASRLARWLPE